MKFSTPFTAKDGLLQDRFANLVEPPCATLPIEAPLDAELELCKLRLAGVQMARVELEDAAVSDADGALEENATLEAFDKVVAVAEELGTLLAIAPFRAGKLTAKRPYGPESISRQQRYLGGLFTRRSSIDGKRLYERPNFAVLEMSFELAAFKAEPTNEGDEFDLYCGRVLMEPFLDHYLSHRVLKTCPLPPEELGAKRLEIMRRHAIAAIDVSKFGEDAAWRRTRFEAALPGVPASTVDAWIRPSGAKGWAPLAVCDCMAIDQSSRMNGGADAWLSFATDGPVDLRFRFPCEAASAKFRPSLRSKIETKVSGCCVELSLPDARYGVLEVNEGTGLPAFSLCVLGDKPMAEPLEGSKALRPGFHKLSELKCGEAKRLFFMPGVHEIEGGKLPLESNREVCVPRGAVVRAGVIAEEVVNAKLFGQGVFDGTPCPRDIGENKGSRMGEKWIDDAGREGFFCFFKGSDIVLDGPTIYNSNFWNIVISGTERCVVRNHKAIAWLQNTDGIQPRSCVDLLVERCFLKCADDCVAVKTRRTLGMESRRLRFKDLVLWHDVPGNGLEIGHTSQANLLEDVRFENIESVHGGNSGHAIGMCIIDHSTVKDVVYDGVYVEGTEYGGDFGFMITPTYYTTDKERGRIKNVTVRNYFSERGPLAGRSCIHGFDASHLVENVKFENLVWHCGDPAKRRKAESVSELLGENVFSKNITAS